MNRNIPERFDKDKIYYTKTPDREELAVYFFDGLEWVREDISSEDSYYFDLYDVTDCTNEIFITKEEYEDLLLIGELKK